MRRASKGPEGAGARLLAFRPPANPKTDPWQQELIAEQNHMQHNFLAMNLDKDPQDEIVSASHEGLIAWKRGKDGTYAKTLIGEGSPGEVKLGRVGGRRMLATVDPWHGAGVMVYAEKPGAAPWARNQIETALAEGHALDWADFDGDGNQELAVGWRGKPFGVAVYFVDGEGALKSKEQVDGTGMATEDLIVGDFNGDKKPDIVASGRDDAERDDLLERDAGQGQAVARSRGDSFPATTRPGSGSSRSCWCCACSVNSSSCCARPDGCHRWISGSRGCSPTPSSCSARCSF